MLTHPTLDKLQTLRLTGMYQALVEQLQMPDIAALTFEERFGLLVDRECTERENRRLTTRLRQAKLRQTACIEDIDYRHPRGLDKALMAPPRHLPMGAGASQRLHHRPNRDWQTSTRKLPLSGRAYHLSKPSPSLIPGTPSAGKHFRLSP